VGQRHRLLKMDQVPIHLCLRLRQRRLQAVQVRQHLPQPHPVVLTCTPLYDQRK
jgi:hypothetical protein